MNTKIDQKINRFSWKKLKKFLPVYLMVLPGFVYMFINNYMPMPGLMLAFKKFKFSKGIWGSPWYGVKNFTFLINSYDLGTILKNTICYNLGFIVIDTIFAVGVAIMLSEVNRKKLQQLFQTVILIPYLLSYVIISYIVYAFFGADCGMVNNSILIPLGIQPVSWYTEASRWPGILTFVHVWKSFGYSSVIYFASILGFDRSYYEAAMVDGASTWKQIIYITLPMLKPTIVTLTLLSIGRIFYSDFGLFYQVPMNSGMLFDTTNTIDTYVYRGLLENNDIGRASAAGFIQSILGFIFVIISNIIVKKVDADNALF